jgi:predicted DNA binding CopG/RHH family protein
MKKDKQILIRIDDDLYTSIKSWCERNGVNLSKKIRNYLESEIKNEKR